MIFLMRSNTPFRMLFTLLLSLIVPAGSASADMRFNFENCYKCRYGKRGAAAAKPKAQIILDAAKVSAASGGCSEPKQGQR